MCLWRVQTALTNLYKASPAIDCTCNVSTSLHIPNLLTGFMTFCRLLTALHKDLLDAGELAEFLPVFTSLCVMLTASTKPVPWFTTICGMLTAFAKATNILHKLLRDEDCTCRMSTSLCELARDANYIYQIPNRFHEPLRGANTTWRTSSYGTVNVLAEPLPALTSHCSTLTALAKFLSGILTASFKALPWFTRLCEMLTALAKYI